MNIEEVNRLMQLKIKAEEEFNDAANKYAKENSKFKIGDTVKYKNRKHTILSINGGYDRFCKEFSPRTFYEIKNNSTGVHKYSVLDRDLEYPKS